MRRTLSIITAFAALLVTVLLAAPDSARRDGGTSGPASQAATTAARKKNVFVIGDSIHLGYSKYLRESLGDSYELITRDGWDKALLDLDVPRGANTGPSGGVLVSLKEYMPKIKVPIDMLLINCGLHDIKRNRKTGKIQVSEDAYRANLIEIVKLAKAGAKHFAWINTTPVRDELNADNKEFFRTSKDADRYNEIAAEVMKSNNVEIIDLYTFTKSLGGAEIYGDYVHFRSEICQKQGAFIADYVLKYWKKQVNHDSLNQRPGE